MNGILHVHWDSLDLRNNRHKAQDAEEHHIQVLHRTTPRHCLHEPFSHLLSSCFCCKGFGVHCCESLLLCSL